MIILFTSLLIMSLYYYFKIPSKYDVPVQIVNNFYYFDGCFDGCIIKFLNIKTGKISEKTFRNVCYNKKQFEYMQLIVISKLLDDDKKLSVTQIKLLKDILDERE